MDAVQKRREWPSLIVLAAMFVAALCAWPFIDPPIPVHWPLNGEPDRFGGRFEGLLVLPLLAGAMYVLLRWLPRVDPARQNYASFAAAYDVLRFAVLLFLGAFHGLILAIAFGADIAINLFLPIAIGALMMVLGNMMGKIRPNYFVGIRTPWTLASERSWTATHRLGGRLMLLIGTLAVLAGLFRAMFRPASEDGVLMSGLGASAAVVVLVLAAYSYWVWRNDGARISVQQTRPAEPR